MDRFEVEFSGNFRRDWEERKTMKAPKFTDAQKAFILKRGADVTALASARIDGDDCAPSEAGGH